MTVTNILSWTSTDGTERAILLITDEEKHHNEIGYQKLELCRMNDNQWETEEVFDNVEEIKSFGFPPGFTD